MLRLVGKQIIILLTVCRTVAIKIKGLRNMINHKIYDKKGGKYGNIKK